MLLCCSQRTDLCAFYSDWLVNRLQAGLVDIRNPFAPRQVLRVDCSSGRRGHLHDQESNADAG